MADSGHTWFPISQRERLAHWQAGSPEMEPSMRGPSFWHTAAPEDCFQQENKEPENPLLKKKKKNVHVVNLSIQDIMLTRDALWTKLLTDKPQWRHKYIHQLAEKSDFSSCTKHGWHNWKCQLKEPRAESLFVLRTQHAHTTTACRLNECQRLTQPCIWDRCYF